MLFTILACVPWYYMKEKCTHKAIIKGIYEVEVKYGHNTKLVIGDFYTSHFCFVKSQQDNVDLLSINGN